MRCGRVLDVSPRSAARCESLSKGLSTVVSRVTLSLTVAGAPIRQLAATGLIAILIGLGLLLVSGFARRRETARERDREAPSPVEADDLEGDLPKSASR